MTKERQNDRQGKYDNCADNAFLYKVESHSEFSEQVAFKFIPDYANSANGYDIIAVCKYPPKFFYNQIFNRLKIESRSHSKQAKEAADNMEILDKGSPIAHALLPSKDISKKDINEYESHAFIKKAKKIFIDTAIKEFPHFMKMRKEVKPEKLIRLCTYTHMPGSRKRINIFNDAMVKPETYVGKKYFKCIDDGFEKFADYAFFKWLNGDCPCYILPPYIWNQWGINHNYIRDFAIFGEKALVEYYSEHKVMVHVDPLSISWPFIKWHILKEHIEDRNYEAAWKPFEFLEQLYSVKKPNGIREKLYSFGGNLKRLVEGADDVEVTNLRMEVHSAFIKYIENETDEDKLNQIYQRLSDKATTSLDKLSKLYHKSANRKEFLNEIMEIIS